MTMVSPRPETERPPGSPRPTGDRAAPDACGPARVEPPGPPDASRAGLRGARTWRRRPRPLWALAALLLLAAVAVAATMGRDTLQQQHAAERRAAALAAGRQIAVNFVTVSATTFDADTRRVLDASTGAFQKEYASTLAQLKPVVIANKTVSRVERAEAALVSADDDSAKVIVGIVAPTTNSATPTPEKKTYRLRLDLVKVGDQWKVGTLDFVS